MAQIPSHAQWMKDTHSLTSPRSTLMKEVDSAIERYGKTPNDQNKQAITTALDKWRFDQSRHGKDWRKSVRNEKGAVTNLHRALSELDKRRLTREELEAMQYIARMQATALQRQFDGKELKFKSNTLLGLASNTGSKWQKFKGASSLVAGGATGAASAASTGRSLVKGAGLVHQVGGAGAIAASQGSMVGIAMKIKELCRELCPGLDPDQVFQALHLGNMEQFAAELAPFVGAISSGGKAIVGWIGVIRQQYGQYKMQDLRQDIAPGDPEAAFDALSALLDREIASAAARATVKTGAFTAKTAGAFADAGAVTGPVVGVLEILAEVIQSIVEYVRDVKECEAANQMLRVGALNLDLFGACPILGCYFLVIQDHSTIINFAVGEYGTEHWMFDVERLVTKVQLVLEKCRELIRLSRLEILGMAGAKGLVEENYSVKTGVGKVTGLPGAISAAMADRLEQWFGDPVKPAMVDKSLIRGLAGAKWRA